MADADVLLGGFGLFGGRGEYYGRIKVSWGLSPLSRCQVLLQEYIYMQGLSELLSAKHSEEINIQFYVQKIVVVLYIVMPGVKTVKF